MPKNLHERWHDCSNCGCSIDRDYNAAINIKNRAVGHPVLEAQSMSEAIAGVSQKPTSMVTACVGVGVCHSLIEGQFHKRGRISQLIEDAGCQLLYLPFYSPDLNKIERRRENRFSIYLAVQSSTHSTLIPRVSRTRLTLWGFPSA